MNANKRLYVHSIEQKIIFCCEMQGQISDGKWENMRPSGHYKPWTALTWDDVVVDPTTQGRTFAVPYCNYNFADQYLLDVVGDRIAYKIRLFKMYPQNVGLILQKDHWLLPDGLNDLHVLTESVSDMIPWVKTKLDGLNKVGLTHAMLFDAAVCGCYGIKELRADCEALKVACRTRIQ